MQGIRSFIPITLTFRDRDALTRLALTNVIAVEAAWRPELI
jgi:hypothetical protein